MENSTLCKDAKREHQGYSNPSHSKPSKAISSREELEGKKKPTNDSMI
jgi:hypothetical protein